MGRAERVTSRSLPRDGGGQFRRAGAFLARLLVGPVIVMILIVLEPDQVVS